LLASDDHAVRFVQQPVDLHRPDEGERQIRESLSTAVDVVAMLVPPPDGYEKPFIARRLPGAGEFAAAVSPFIEWIILSIIGSRHEGDAVMSPRHTRGRGRSLKGVTQADLRIGVGIHSKKQ
jgi:hypothetical protein